MRVSASATEEGYAEMARILAPATVGRLAEALPPGGYEGRIDQGASIVVDLAFGGLENADRTALLSGANGLALEAASGAWEIVQFERAEEIAAGRWRLTGLLRGQAGTDDAMANGASAGARVFRLDGAPAPLAIEAGQAGLARNFIVEPIGLAGAGAVGPVSFAGGLRARTPLSPVHLKAARTADGVRLTWIRRSRIDADNWLPADIPLGEERERYLIEILDGPSVLRTAEVDAPEWLYPAADELADFGTPRGQIAFRVRQAGRHVPWGLPRSTSLTLS